MTHWHFIAAIIIASVFVATSTTAQNANDSQWNEPIKTIDL